MKILCRALFVLVVLFTPFSIVWATDLNSRSDGTWSDTGQGGPDCGCEPDGGSQDSIYSEHDVTIIPPNPGTYTEQGILHIENNTFTIDGNMVVQGTLRVTAGSTLHITGNLTFNNGSNIIIEEGATLIVNGNFENKNNSDDVTFDGSVTIDGSFENGTGGVIDFGPNADITVSGTCTNTGTVTEDSGSTTGTCGGTILPIKIADIWINKIENNAVAELNWIAFDAENFSHFIIEKGIYNPNTLQFEYAEVGRKDFILPTGKGNASVYQFIDKSPILGRNYYRLAAYDLQLEPGSEIQPDYFYADPIYFEGANYELKVYPNPSFGEDLTISINFPLVNSTSLRIFNLQGELVHQHRVDEYNFTMPLSENLPSGIYIMVVKSANGINLQKKIVLE